MHFRTIFKDRVRLRHLTSQISVAAKINGIFDGLASLAQSFELAGCGKSNRIRRIFPPSEKFVRRIYRMNAKCIVCSLRFTIQQTSLILKFQILLNIFQYLSVIHETKGSVSNDKWWHWQFVVFKILWTVIWRSVSIHFQLVMVFFVHRLHFSSKYCVRPCHSSEKTKPGWGLLDS